MPGLANPLTIILIYASPGAIGGGVGSGIPSSGGSAKIGALNERTNRAANKTSAILLNNFILPPFCY